MTARGMRPASVAALLVAGLVTWGCQGGAPANMPMETIGAWQVGATNEPDPPRVGDNTLLVAARDSSGRPLRGTVEVIVGMPAMGSMPSMESRGKVKRSRAGVFVASYGIPMGGEWDVTVRLDPESGPPAEAHYRLSTSFRGLVFAGGTRAAGVADAVPPESAATADSAGGAVAIDAARRQSLGIRTEAVQVRDLSMSLRVPGRVAYDESHRAEVALKFGGFVRTLAARVTGQAVRRGQILFTVYSPELWSAEQEYLEAVRSARASQGSGPLGLSAADIAGAARERLLLWDVSPGDLAAIARSEKPLQEIPIRSPVSGIVTDKNIVQGSAFTAGQTLFRIAGLDPVWVIASVPQPSVGFVRPGTHADIHDPSSDSGARHGVVSFVSPSLDSTTRTAAVRISVPNPGGGLQPGSFVDVELSTPLVRRLAVPESAVLPTGERHVVFVDLGDGRLAPREVQLGIHAGGYYEVRAGLVAGDAVVTSGNFVVAAESRLRSAAQKW